MKNRHFALLGAMTAAERSKGRFMRGPDDHPASKSVSDIATELRAHFDGKMSAELDGRLRDFEQKMARGGGHESPAATSWGQEFTTSPEFKSYSEEEHARPSRLRLELKTITSAATGTSAAGAMVDPFRDGLVTIPQRQVRVRDLLTPVTVTSGSVEYPRQTTRTNAADMVAEGATKPESNYAFELATAPIRTIAHWVAASVQILEDAPQLSGMIDGELRYGLQIKEDNQLLNGDGLNQNILGINAVATAFVAPTGSIVAGTTPVDRIADGILQVMLQEYTPDGIILNPVDWFNIVRVKDAAGGYLIANPATLTNPTLWGLPVVATQAQAVGKFTVGQFKSSTLYDRWQPRVEVSTEHADFFTRNLVAIRGEERIGLANKQPKALVYGNVNPT